MSSGVQPENCVFPKVGRVTATMIAGTTVTNSTVQVGQQIGYPIFVSDKFYLFHDQRASNMSKKINYHRIYHCLVSLRPLTTIFFSLNHLVLNTRSLKVPSCGNNSCNTFNHVAIHSMLWCSFSRDRLNKTWTRISENFKTFWQDEAGIF